MDKLKGMIVGILEDKSLGNCSNNGISKFYKKVLLVGDGVPKIFEESEDYPTVKLVKRMIGAKMYLHCEPINKPTGRGWMASGVFVHSCDSRFPNDYPIALHDRQEF
ncbi:hypothetical protein [Terrisporobacter glycolicus]|uniref:hypothetical protein n=1 Tax=Terrisporobacter glycolicus TaxID=36841 RepID=UPI003463D9CC